MFSCVVLLLVQTVIIGWMCSLERAYRKVGLPKRHQEANDTAERGCKDGWHRRPHCMPRNATQSQGIEMSVIPGSLSTQRDLHEPLCNPRRFDRELRRYVCADHLADDIDNQ
ncbi:hypothetical protein F5Y01DRAFT_68505 [Xylaria sp. FL0043]|nr:hypothetical protein F5Y01DRAFT_68505 [Xylaria sp. FL0043]